MQNYKKIAEKYDVAIIGSDLSSIILAQLLSSEHDLKTVIVSSKNSLEDFRKDAEANPVVLDEPFEFYPANEESLSLLNWFSDSVLGAPLAGDQTESTPVTFDSGDFKPFVGFGDRKFTTIDAIDYYCEQNQIQLQLGADQWGKLLLEKYEGDILPKSFVTQVIIEDKNVSSLIINDNKKLIADKVVFCGASKELLELIPNEAMPGRVRQKIAKGKSFHRLNLHISYSELFDIQNEVHVLMGTKDDFEPVVGQFQVTTSEEGEQQLHSEWTYLLDSMEYEDPEVLGSLVKYMKRQIKRAYPDSFEVIASERISVFKDSHGTLDLDSARIKGIDNLVLGMNQMGHGQGLQSQLSSAKTSYDQFFSSEA